MLTIGDAARLLTGAPTDLIALALNAVVGAGVERVDDVRGGRFIVGELTH